MKYALTPLLFLAQLSMAKPDDTKAIVRCYGEHHGNYVNIEHDKGVTKVLLSTDADEDESPTRVFTVKTLSKNGKVATADEVPRWIRDSVLDQSSGDYKGTAIIRAEGEKGNILINLRTFKSQNFLADEHGYVEELTCRLDP